LEEKSVISAKSQLVFKENPNFRFQICEVLSVYKGFQFPTSDGWSTLATQNASFVLLASFNWFTEAWKTLAHYLLYSHFLKGT